MGIFSKESSRGELYVITGKLHMPIARAMIYGDPDADEWQAELVSGEEETVLDEDVVELVRLADDMYTIIGRVKGKKDGRILLERVMGRSGDARRSLRVPIGYDTYIYPADGAWEGRCLVKCKDLSCGGIAFHLPMTLALGTSVDVVVRTQEEPLVVRGEVLREIEKKDGMDGYAVCFRDICPDEDALLCKEVFGVQLRAAFADSLDINEGQIKELAFTDSDYHGHQLYWLSTDNSDISGYFVIAGKDYSVEFLEVRNNTVNADELAAFKYRCGWIYGIN